MAAYRRSARTLGVTFVAYALLVALNLGEFWPFSIYPMFSQGGIPWSRSVVREVPDVDAAALAADDFWQAVRADRLPGEAYALAEHGVDPIDLANFVSKTRTWDAQRVEGLRYMFGENTLEERTLLVMRVNGRIIDGDSVAVIFEPYVLMNADTSVLGPGLAADWGED